MSLSPSVLKIKMSAPPFPSLAPKGAEASAHTDNPTPVVKPLQLETDTLTTSRILSPAPLHAKAVENDRQILTTHLATQKDLLPLGRLALERLHVTAPEKTARLFKTILNRSESEQQALMKDIFVKSNWPGLNWIKRQILNSSLGNKMLSSFTAEMRSILNSPEDFKAFVAELRKPSKLVDSLALQDGIKSINDIYLKEPKADILFLKDPQQAIVGYGEVKPLQKHLMTLSPTDQTAVDRKHAFIDLYIDPKTRGQGAGEALGGIVINRAKQLGYTHAWTTTMTSDSPESEKAAHALSKQWGAQPATLKTRFPESPAFTEDRMKHLLNEYAADGKMFSWHKL